MWTATTEIYTAPLFPYTSLFRACGGNRKRSGRRPEEGAGLQRWRARACPEDETVTGHDQYGPLLGVAEPAQDRGDQRHAVAIGAVRNHIEIDPHFGVDLPTKIVQGHQKISGEDIGLVLDLSVLGIPTHHVLLAAADTLGIGQAVQKEMAECVCEREIDSALRPDPVVVDDAPALSARRRPKQGAVEAQIGRAHV